MKIKLFYSLFLLSILFSSCQTLFNPSMLKVKKEPIPILLKKLDISRPIEQVNNTKTISTSAPVFTIFERNLEINWMETESDRTYGKIEIINISANNKFPFLFPFLSGLTLFSLNLLGMPLYEQKFSAEYDVIITDTNGKRVQKYNYIGNSKTTYGFYYGKDGSTVGIEAIKDVMAQLNSDLARDAKMINDKLEKAYNK